jgi:hypothetical protein
MIGSSMENASSTKIDVFSAQCHEARLLASSAGS